MARKATTVKEFGICYQPLHMTSCSAGEAQTRFVVTNTPWYPRVELLLEGECVEGNIIVAFSGESKVIGVYQVTGGGLTDCARQGRRFAYPSVPVWAVTAAGAHYLREKYPKLLMPVQCVEIAAGSDFFASPEPKSTGAAGSSSQVSVTDHAAAFAAAMQGLPSSQSVIDRRSQVVGLSNMTGGGPQFTRLCTEAGKIDNLFILGAVRALVDPTHHGIAALKPSALAFTLNGLFAEYERNPIDAGGVNIVHHVENGKTSIESNSELVAALETFFRVQEALWTEPGAAPFFAPLMEPMRLRLTSAATEVRGMAKLPVAFNLSVVNAALVRTSSVIVNPAYKTWSSEVKKSKLTAALELSDGHMLTWIAEHSSGGGATMSRTSRRADTWRESRPADDRRPKVSQDDHRRQSSGDSAHNRRHTISSRESSHGSGPSSSTAKSSTPKEIVPSGNERRGGKLCRQALLYHLKVSKSQCDRPGGCSYAHDFVGRSKGDMRATVEHLEPTERAAAMAVIERMP